MQSTAVLALVGVAVAIVAMVRFVVALARTAQHEPETPTHEAARARLWQSSGVLLLVACLTVGLAADANLRQFPPVLALLGGLGVLTILRSIVLQRRLP